MPRAGFEPTIPVTARPPEVAVQYVQFEQYILHDFLSRKFSTVQTRAARSMQ
jgi:hypothetical protein